MYIYKQVQALWPQTPPVVSKEVAHYKVPNVDGYLKSWLPKYHALLGSLRVTKLAELLHPGNTFKSETDLEAEGHRLPMTENKTYRTMIYHLGYEMAGQPIPTKLPVGLTCRLHPSYGVIPKPKQNWAVSTLILTTEPIHLEVLTGTKANKKEASDARYNKRAREHMDHTYHRYFSTSNYMGPLGGNRVDI